MYEPKGCLRQITSFMRNFFLIKLSGKKSFKNKTKAFEKWYQPAKPFQQSIEPRITWIGQSAFLIQIDGINILTDPNFFGSLRVFRRIIPPGIPIDQLPLIDFLIISHDHRDHMEKRSIQRLVQHNPITLAPKGLSYRLSKWGMKKIVEHKVGDTYTIKGTSGNNITFTFLPAAHWSGSNLFNIHSSLCGSWMIGTESHKTYFAGDTSYAGHFLEIGKQFTNINAALLPIGPIEPRAHQKHAHTDGAEAVQAFIDLDAKNFVPMHWGTFHLGGESFEDPIEILETAWNKNKALLENKALRLLKFGKGELF